MQIWGIIMTELKQIKDQLEVFQVCDSTFPIGSFNHSYGMETYLREEMMEDDASFKEWLLIYLQTQFKYSEALAILLVYQAQEAEEKWEKIKEIDHRLCVSTLSKETRDGAKMVAKQMTKLVMGLFPNKDLKQYGQMIEQKEVYGHPAIVFGLFSHDKHLELKEAVMYYGYSILSTMVQNAVRAIPLGQQPGQLILKEALATLEKVTKETLSLTMDDLGANMPGIELAQMKHEVQIFRLFMS